MNDTEQKILTIPVSDNWYTKYVFFKSYKAKYTSRIL